MEGKQTPPHPPESTSRTKPKSQGKLLMEITAISGEYPAKNIHRLIPAPSYAKKVISTLVADKQIKLVSTGGLKGYRLMLMGKRKLVAGNPARFAGFLDGAVETNKMRTGYERRLRLHSLAEVCTLMHGAGVEIFSDVKPRIFLLDTPNPLSQPHNEKPEGGKPPKVDNLAGHGNPTQHPPSPITSPCFYTSREQKGTDDNAIRGSRATGTLLTTTHVYAIYNTGSAESRWSEKTEQRYKAEMQDYICRKLLSHQYSGVPMNGIIVGDNLETLEKYLAVKEKKQPGYNFLTKVYQSFYYITNDNHGEIQLRLLCDDGKMAGLRNALLKGMRPPDNAYPIEHDALTEDGNPVLFCCLLNIPRLIRFRNGAALHKKAGKIIAFDFQLEMLERYLGDTATFVSLSFDKLVRQFFHE